jgi:hypothetical protein
MGSNWSYGVDPTTGVQGIKFDTGYSSGGSSDGNSGNGDNSGGSGGNGGNGNGRGNRPKRMAILENAAAIEDYGETRLISITLEGNHSFGTVSVTIKAAQLVWTDEVTVSSGASTSTANGGCDSIQ